MTGGVPKPTVQRTGASRFAQRQIESHRRLVPVADLGVVRLERSITNRHFLFLACCVLSTFCTGCASIWCHVDRDLDNARVYPGATQDARLLAHPNEITQMPKGIAYPFIVVDLPASAAVDTVLLPFDLFRHKSNAAPHSDIEEGH